MFRGAMTCARHGRLPAYGLTCEPCRRIRSVLARIESLELANQAKDMQVKELQNLLSAMDGRFGEVDKEWRDSDGAPAHHHGARTRPAP